MGELNILLVVNHEGAVRRDHPYGCGKHADESWYLGSRTLDKRTKTMVRQDDVDVVQQHCQKRQNHNIRLGT